MLPTTVLGYANLIFGLISTSIGIVIIMMMVGEGGGVGLNIGTVLALGFAANGIARLVLSAKQRGESSKAGRTR